MKHVLFCSICNVKLTPHSVGMHNSTTCPAKRFSDVPFLRIPPK